MQSYSFWLVVGSQLLYGPERLEDRLFLMDLAWKLK